MLAVSLAKRIYRNKLFFLIAKHSRFRWNERPSFGHGRKRQLFVLDARPGATAPSDSVAPSCQGRARGSAVPGHNKRAIGGLSDDLVYDGQAISHTSQHVLLHGFGHRSAISGILHVIKSGRRWCDCPPEYGPPTTIYNRLVRWAERGVWERLFRELAARGRSTQTQMIDATHVKAHRSASGAKRGNRAKRLDAHVAGAIRKSTQSQMLRAVFLPSC
jgi:transposase